jgi:integrase/recombinase XerD
VAVEFGRQQRIRLENYGTASTSLPPGKIEEAAAAFDRLKGTGATLTEAVEHFLAWQRRRASSVTFAVLFERFVAAKMTRRAAYKAQLRQTQNRFSTLNGRMAVDVTPDEIDEIANTAAPARRNGFLRVIRAVFNFGIRKGWCSENPVLRLDFSRLERHTQMLTNEQVVSLLQTCSETDFPLLPYLLLTIFAGIRPNEAKQVTWDDDINFDENFVRIRGEHSKTGVRRIVEMDGLLVRWLSYYRESGGNTVGCVAPPGLRKRLRSIRRLAGFDDWPADAPRRTFASCHFAFYNDVDTLCRLLGHKSPVMLWEHYNKAVTQKRAAAFWKIEPPGKIGKMIRFAAA